MKQIFQSLRNGEIALEDVPVPAINPQSLLIQSSKSLISSGTERMLVDFGKSNYIQKAVKQQERVKDAINKIKTEGLPSVYRKITLKLDQPIPLGYCNVGKVVGIGSKVTGFELGDRVISNGAHSEFVSVNKNLCAKVPTNVIDDDAVYAIIGSVALHGIRLSEPTIGENYLVIGLGIVGLMAVQILIANGCNVVAADINEDRLNIANDYGCKVLNLNKKNDLASEIYQLGFQDGLDAAIIATASQDSLPIEQAANVLRKKGRIVLVGTSDINVSRNLFYEKEISFQVSCSYGPGRYDDNYELHGNDYPINYVRWTEKRNFESVLGLMEKGMLNLSQSMTTHNYKLENCKDAYKTLMNERDAMGIVLDYPGNSSKEKTVLLNQNLESNLSSQDQVIIDFIGMGNYAQSTLAPHFYSQKVIFNKILSNTSTNSLQISKKYSFQALTSDQDEVFKTSDSNTVVVSTKHDSHAEYFIKAVKANKNIFLEKPLCISNKEFIRINKCLDQTKSLPIIMMGFNRRFSPLIQRVKNYLKPLSHPIFIDYTINAGKIDEANWVHDPLIGGGRLIGEACHFLDLSIFLAASAVASFSIENLNVKSKDSFCISLKFENGSIAKINYITFGPKSWPKEHIQIISNNEVINIEDFKKLYCINSKDLKSAKLYSQDKGQSAAIAAFVDAVKNGKPSPIKLQDIIDVTKLSLDLSAMDAAQDN